MRKIDYVTAEKIRKLHASGISQRILAERFGLRHDYICHIIARNVWAFPPKSEVEHDAR